jgi:hypothetical protein
MSWWHFFLFSVTHTEDRGQVHVPSPWILYLGLVVPPEGLACQANERLAQKSTDGMDLWTLCAWLKEEVALAWREAAPLGERVYHLEEDLIKVSGEQDQF